MVEVVRQPAGAFGRLVRDTRKLRNLSQERLGELAGLSGGYISLIESGKRGERPSRETVVAIAQALGEEPVKFLRVAGRLEDADEASRPLFVDVVRDDPTLRADQKRVLVDLYGVFVRGRR